MKMMAKFVGKNRDFRQWLREFRRCAKAWDRVKELYKTIEGGKRYVS